MHDDAEQSAEHTLTMSFDVASASGHAETGASLLLEADRALHAAKRPGRDRTVIFSAETVGAVAQPEGSDRPPEHLASVLMLADTLDLRDSGTADHSLRVGRYAEAIARELGLAEDHVERVRLAGVLHDIGMLGVPDAVLQKPGRLTDGEFDQIRKHPELGARILAGGNLDDISTGSSRTTSAPTGAATRSACRATRSPSRRGSSPSRTPTRR
jgi:putative nucleotidyltransferase with HDIG domain